MDQWSRSANMCIVASSSWWEPIDVYSIEKKPPHRGVATAVSAVSMIRTPGKESFFAIETKVERAPEQILIWGPTRASYATSSSSYLVMEDTLSCQGKLILYKMEIFWYRLDAKHKLSFWDSRFLGIVFFPPCCVYSSQDMNMYRLNLNIRWIFHFFRWQFLGFVFFPALVLV